LRVTVFTISSCAYSMLPDFYQQHLNSNLENKIAIEFRLTRN
jgi:hypothetical protein